MSAPIRFAGRSAFTLVELLTVIAIIGVLAAILIPTVAKMRKTAHAAGCTVALRQIGAATALFAGEHKGKAPIGDSGANGGNGHWYIQIAPYLGVTFPEGLNTTEKMRLKGTPASCRLAPQAGGDVQAIGASYGWTAVPIVSGMPYLQNGPFLNQIPQPARTIMISERWGQNSGGNRDTNWAVSPPYVRTALDTDDPLTTNAPGALRLSHGGRAHFLFFDGHVAAHLPSETYDDSDLSTGNLWRGL